MYGLVIVHEDGATVSAMDLPEGVARMRFEAATRTFSVVYAHYSNDSYDRVNHYVREN